jgi:hypothetical protein
LIRNLDEMEYEDRVKVALSLDPDELMNQQWP